MKKAIGYAMLMFAFFIILASAYHVAGIYAFISLAFGSVLTFLIIFGVMLVT